MRTMILNARATEKALLKYKTEYSDAFNDVARIKAEKLYSIIALVAPRLNHRWACRGCKQAHAAVHLTAASFRHWFHRLRPFHFAASFERACIEVAIVAGKP